MSSTDSSTIVRSQWLRDFITTEVGLEDQLVHIFNMKRKAIELDIRDASESDEIHAANLVTAQILHERAALMLEEQAGTYDQEIMAVNTSAQLPNDIRYDQAPLVDDKALKKAKDLEIARLDSMAKMIRGFLDKEFAGLPSFDTRARFDLPEERLVYGQRETSLRYDFWRARMNAKAITCIYRDFTPNIAIYASMQQSKPFARFMTCKAVYFCDLFWQHMVYPRIVNDSIQRADDPLLRLCRSVEENPEVVIKAMESFYDNYNDVDAPTPRPTLSDILVTDNSTLDDLFTDWKKLKSL